MAHKLLLIEKNRLMEKSVAANIEKYLNLNTCNYLYRMIQQIGNLVGKEERAAALQQNIRRQFNLFNPFPMAEKSCPLSVAYFIWKDPLLSVGGDTFIHDMLSRCGLKNVFMAKTRYPEITMEELSHLSPDVIILSSEPFPFKEKHLAVFKVACPESKIHLADGEFFSWYGSRLLKAPDYFRSLVKQIHYSN